MSNIRVMVCDDSSMMRRLLVSTLNNVDDMSVVSEAVHGQDALEKLPRCKPDLVIMDIGMPVMDGIEAVREIRKVDRKIPVIVFSALTQDGAEATLDAMSAGANDVATKPIEAGNIANAVSQLKKELLPKIYRLISPNGRIPNAAGTKLGSFAGKRDTHGVSIDSSTMAPSPPRLLNPGPIDAVGIGVSTGGPKALATLVSKLPTDLRVPIFIVQHMPASFTALLAERLSAERGHSVVEATEDQVIRPGQIVIAPGGYHTTVIRRNDEIITKLNLDPPIHSCRPAVDPLFRSLAKTFGSGSLGVILTGMGVDGTEGARALKEAGCMVVVQDKETSVVWGMPGNVVQQGLADKVLPIDRIALEIDRVVSK